MLLVMVLLSWRTDWLRDAGPVAPSEPGARPTYSLARVQLAVWTFSVCFGFVLLWMVNGRCNGAIPSTILGFLGISVGTTMAANLIDTSGGFPGTAQEAPTPAPPSRGFWRDVLSDGTAINLHRFQIVLWLLVVVAMFWVDLLLQLMALKKVLAMPDFHSSLMVLMGISHGTYLGMKTTENGTGPAPAGPGPSAPQASSAPPPDSGA
jgi:hypothetical protein